MYNIFSIFKKIDYFYFIKLFDIKIRANPISRIQPYLETTNFTITNFYQTTIKEYDDSFALIFKINSFHAVRHTGQYFIGDRT